MKKKHILLIAAASMMAVGCVKEMEVSIDNVTYVTKTFKAKIDEDTKTSVDSDGKVTWNAGDVIMYYSADNGIVAECSVAEDCASATLTMNVAEGASYLASVYGGSAIPENTASSATVAGAIPAEQTGVFGVGHLAAAKLSDMSKTTLNFHNISSYIKFTLSRTDVKKVVFSSNDGTALTGNGTVVLTFSDDDISAAFGESKSSSITVNNGGSGTFYIATLPCTMASGFTADCFDESGNYLGSAVSGKSATVKKGTILNLGTIDTHIEKVYKNLSDAGTANSYIVSNAGCYKFDATVKGSSNQSLDGTPATAAVIWESFGTGTVPSAGDLVSGAEYSDGYVSFTASAKKGNAVIAVKDASDKVLWSWHIWMTDKPEEQVYKNNAGTVLDRNLGATSAAKGDVCALGLLYQWGRKDPFLTSSSLTRNDQAASTISWPQAVASTEYCGTNEYAVANPTTFVMSNGSNNDWYYTGNSSTDDTRWQESAAGEKGVYDPCPAGYRVPDGGVASNGGVWSTAFGTSSSISMSLDATNRGIDFGTTDNRFGEGTIWYPAAGSRYYVGGVISNTGYTGFYWSCTPDASQGKCLMLSYYARFADPSYSYSRAEGMSVRCVKDNSYINPKTVTDLSAAGIANCYIVPSAGAYKFEAAFKGASSEKIDGSPSKAVILWESFGTGTAPAVGDLVSRASYSGGYISFKASGKNGNAVIALEDASGKILWSWHIWLCQGYDPDAYAQSYRNGAGTMMDRNLGATSATPGDVGALGLMYQWGRKDPFLGSSSTSSSSVAQSTITWPSAEDASAHLKDNNTLEYSIENPTVFLKNDSSPSDWYATSSSNSSSSLWSSSKTKYDPCPSGYKVPEGVGTATGGTLGYVWAKAMSSAKSWYTAGPWDGTNYGCDFGSSSTSVKLGDGVIWYPACGYYNKSGKLATVGEYGHCWACTSNTQNVSSNNFYYGCIGGSPSSSSPRALGYSVRCVKDDGSVKQITDLSSASTANCYIVSASGTYKFKTVKGNSNESVGTVASASVLWESYGTDETLSEGALVSIASFNDRYIFFNASGRKGNAVIAAKDASGKILWSWHIWMTDQPEDQVYKNNAGTMMDRNLGATSATPGDVGALGLMYQWGRKDPFLGSSSTSSSVVAQSTIKWPSVVSSDATNGTIEYATANPTTFIAWNSNNYDWYYTGNSTTDNTRWQTSDEEKTLYDPCPAGYRVPDGGESGVWSKAFNAKGSSWKTDSNWDSTNKGMDFGYTEVTLGTGTIWYPASGFLHNESFTLVGSTGLCWSCSISDRNAYRFYFNEAGVIHKMNVAARSHGIPVRCCRE